MATKATIMVISVFASIVFLPAADASVTVSITVPRDYSVSGACINTPVGCIDRCIPPICIERVKPDLAAS